MVAYGAEFTHDRKRLGPLEAVRAEHGCLEKFEVSENMIIRTQDSRLLGAKFLNESDVGNREDCLTLCCSTPLCNVAVFEEKVRAGILTHSCIISNQIPTHSSHSSKFPDTKQNYLFSKLV